MIVRGQSGWQTVLADLSLILFMVMASSVQDARSASSMPAAPAMAGAIAIWRDGKGAPPLDRWLAANRDPRLGLTITASPAEAGKALELARSADRTARIVLEPGATGYVATLSFDRFNAAATAETSGDDK